MRLVILKQTYGMNAMLPDCVCKILVKGLRLETDGEFEIERVHRQLAPMPNTDQPLRPVLIRQGKA